MICSITKYHQGYLSKEKEMGEALSTREEFDEF
jgi:hypothetical protein